jgi:hypothetical protein
VNLHDVGLDKLRRLVGDPANAHVRPVLERRIRELEGGTKILVEKADTPRMRGGELEAQQQARGIAHLRSTGWRVWRIGQKNATGTQDPGVPDVVAIHVEHGLLWWEAKREFGGEQSAAQKGFQAACRAAGVAYVCGNFAALLEHLHASEVAA